MPGAGRLPKLLGADDGTRTRDPHLGKVMLYQLSHIRSNSPFGVQVETYPPYVR